MEIIKPELITQVANVSNESRVTPFRWRGLNIIVRQSIGLREYVEFVQAVLQGCTDSETGDFHIEMLDLIFRATVIMIFTNIELPEDLETQFKLLFWTGLYNEVLLRINDDQLKSLNQTIEHYITN